MISSMQRATSVNLHFAVLLMETVEGEAELSLGGFWDEVSSSSVEADETAALSDSGAFVVDFGDSSVGLPPATRKRIIICNYKFYSCI